MKSVSIVLATSFVSAWLKVHWLPPFMPLFALFCAMGIDYATGVAKAIALKEARTSAGYRRTVAKVTQYGGAIVLSCFATVCAQYTQDGKYRVLAGFMGDSFLWWVVYIEITSILENLYAIDKTSKMSRYVYQPLLKLCTYQFKDNPIFSAAEALEDQVK